MAAAKYWRQCGSKDSGVICAMGTDQERSVPSGISTLIAGGIVAYPTEAVWGLGCDPGKEMAVRRILAAKNRVEEKGLILVASDTDAITEFLQALAQDILEKFQALSIEARKSGRATTWLFPNDGFFPAWITGEHPTVAIRITDHPIAAALAAGIGGLLVSTSANPAGKTPAKSLLEAEQYFGDAVDCYVAGELGSNSDPSAIIDLASGRRLR